MLKFLLINLLSFTSNQLETVSGKQTTVKLNPGKLTPGKEYKFRVRAVNSEGESDNLETDFKTKAKNPYDEPKAPGVPKITDWDNVSGHGKFLRLYQRKVLLSRLITCEK